MDDENARLRAALANTAALAQILAQKAGMPDTAEVLVNGVFRRTVGEILDGANAALTPAPEAPKSGEGGMPERIWADPPETFDGTDMWRSDPGGKGVEYIRADLVAAPSPGADFKAGMLRAAEIAFAMGEVRILAEDMPYRIAAKIRAEAEKIAISDAGGGAVTAFATSQPGETPVSSAPAPLTVIAGRRYIDGRGEVKGPLRQGRYEAVGLLTDNYTFWNPDGTLAGGSRDDPRSLVAEVGE